MNKGMKIAGFICLGIILIPLAVILAYVAVGASVFIILYIIGRKNKISTDPNESKSYKIASTICFCIAIALVWFVGSFNVLTWQGYLWLQLIVFIGMIPMCVYQIRKLQTK